MDTTEVLSLFATYSIPARLLVDATVIEDQTFTGSPKVAGIDNHAHTPERRDTPTIYVDCKFDSAGASEALKLSRHSQIVVISGTIIGGVEDGLDIVRGWDLWFAGVTFLRGAAGQDVTIKGGARDVHFIDCLGLSRVTVGDYTKYDARAVYPDGTTRKALPWRCARPPVRGLSIVGSPDCEAIEYHAEATTGDMRRPFLARRRLVSAPYFWARSTFFMESNPAPSEELKLLPEELT